MAKIQPKFNVSETTGALLPGYGQNHTSVRAFKNRLMPALFNEYERVMCTLIDAMGDVDYGSLLGTSFGTYLGQPLLLTKVPADLAEALGELKQAIKTIYETKIGPQGGTITGTLTVSASTEYPLAVDGKISSHGIVLNWQQEAHYTVGTLVQHEGMLYQCIEAHTASNLYSQIAYWKPISELGGSRFIITVPPGYSEEFEPGDVVGYDNGYTRTRALSDAPLPIGVIVERLSETVYLVATTGMVEFSVEVFPSAGVYYLSDTLPGKVSTIAPDIARPIYSAISETKAFILNNHYRTGTYLEVETFAAAYDGQVDYQLRFTPASEDFVFVTINELLQPPTSYTILEGGVLHIILGEGEQILQGDRIVARYFYGNEITAVDVVMEGYPVGNESGNIPIANGVFTPTLHADLLDGRHVGNASGDIPVNNGVLSVALNADMLDGEHASKFPTWDGLADIKVPVGFDMQAGKLTTGCGYDIIASGDTGITDAASRIFIDGEKEVYITYLCPPEVGKIHVYQLVTVGEEWSVSVLAELDHISDEWPVLVGTLTLPDGSVRAVYIDSTGDTAGRLVHIYDVTYDPELDTASLLYRGSGEVEYPLGPRGVWCVPQQSFIALSASGCVAEVAPSGDFISLTPHEVQGLQQDLSVVFNREVGDDIYCFLIRQIDGNFVSGEIGVVRHQGDNFTYTTLASREQIAEDTITSYGFYFYLFGLSPVQYPFISFLDEIYYVDQSYAAHSIYHRQDGEAGYLLGAYERDANTLFLHDSCSTTGPVVHVVDVSGIPSVVRTVNIDSPLIDSVVLPVPLGTPEHPYRAAVLGGEISTEGFLFISYNITETYEYVPVAPFTVGEFNSARVEHLNADMVDGYHAGNSSGQIPVSNGTVNTNLNADMLDGLHVSDLNTVNNTTYSPYYVQSSEPSSPYHGWLWYNTTNNKLYKYNALSTSWVEIDWQTAIQATPEWQAGKLRVKDGILQIADGQSTPVWWNCYPLYGSGAFTIQDYTKKYYLPLGHTCHIKNTNIIPIVYCIQLPTSFNIYGRDEITIYASGVYNTVWFATQYTRMDYNSHNYSYGTTVGHPVSSYQYCYGYRFCMYDINNIKYTGCETHTNNSLWYTIQIASMSYPAPTYYYIGTTKSQITYLSVTRIM